MNCHYHCTPLQNDVSVAQEREVITEADLRIGQFSGKHVRIKGAMLLENINESVCSIGGVLYMCLHMGRQQLLG